jgi:uncharacterized protein involved in exopolysaccharide biosynthesis
MNFTIAEITTLITAIVLVLGSLYQGRKSTAEASGIYVKAAGEAVTSQASLQEQINKLRERLDEKEKKIEDLEKLVGDLTDQLKQKDARINELETLTINQQNELTRLRSEINILNNRGSSDMTE